MDDDAEAGVEEHEPDGWLAVPLLGRLGAVEDVETEGEGQVGDHGQPVGQGEPGEDAVGGRDHVPSGEDDDVEKVGHDAEQTDDSRQVSVDVHVPIVE